MTGYALRFPRAMKPVIREDANTVDEIIKMARQQKPVNITGEYKMRGEFN